MNRMRLVGWNVQPVVMADDGQNLVPVSVGGQFVSAANWGKFKAGEDDAALAAVRAQIESAEAAK